MIASLFKPHTTDSTHIYVYIIFVSLHRGKMRLKSFVTDGRLGAVQTSGSPQLIFTRQDAAQRRPVGKDLPDPANECIIRGARGEVETCIELLFEKIGFVF